MKNHLSSPKTWPASPAFWLTLLALVLAAALKAALLIAGRVPFNADEAIVALMARHILQGARPVFFYGQAYMGSLDAWLVAGFFRLVGEQVVAIRLVQTLLYLGFLLATAWVGRLAFASWWSGALAALLLAIPTVNITLYTTASLGGYGEALLIGSLLLAVALLLVSRLAEGRRSFGLWLVFGFLSGLGLWAFGLTVVFSLPAGVYLLWGLAKMPVERGKKLRIAVTGILLAAFGFLLGASPWLGYAAQNGLGKLTSELSGGAIAGVEGLPWILQVYQHTLNLLLLGTTVAFGVRPPWSANWLVLPLVPFLLVLWLAVSLYAVWSENQPSPTRPRRLLLLGVMGTLFLAFIFTPFGADPSGRYFVALAAPLALFGADLVLHLRGRYGRVAYGLVALVLAYNLLATWQVAQIFPPGLTTQFYSPSQVDHRYDQPLIDFLRQQGETRGYSNYWVAYPLAFLSSQELLFVPRLPYHTDLRYTERDDRYPPYDEQVAAADRVAYITTNTPALDETLRAKFTEIGITWQEAQIGDFHVYYRLSAPVRPQEIGLGVTTP